MRSAGRQGPGAGAGSWVRWPVSRGLGEPAGAAQTLANTELCGEHELPVNEHLLDIPSFLEPLNKILAK